MPEIVKMSAKGQLVVPQDIREDAGFRPSDRFIPLRVKQGVLFRKVEVPDLSTELGSLAQELQRQFRRRKVTKRDVSGAVRWARSS